MILSNEPGFYKKEKYGIRTENLIIASSMAEGITILSNCAIELEIKDLVNFINCIGGKIKWIGKRTIKNIFIIIYYLLCEPSQNG